MVVRRLQQRARTAEDGSATLWSRSWPRSWGRVALTIELTRTCDHGGAVETATDQPGTQRFDERIRDGSSYRDRRF